LNYLFHFSKANFLNKKQKTKQDISLGSFLSSIYSQWASGSDLENLRYALSIKPYEKPSQTPWNAARERSVRKTCRPPAGWRYSRALARLFQQRMKGEMRPMPVVQVHNKKEAQCTP
jgi:hypothetical protein